MRLVPTSHSRRDARMARVTRTRHVTRHCGTKSHRTLHHHHWHWTNWTNFEILYSDRRWMMNTETNMKKWTTPNQFNSDLVIMIFRRWSLLHQMWNETKLCNRNNWDNADIIILWRHLLWWRRMNDRIMVSQFFWLFLLKALFHFISDERNLTFEVSSKRLYNERIYK